MLVKDKTRGAGGEKESTQACEMPVSEMFQLCASKCLCSCSSQLPSEHLFFQAFERSDVYIFHV